MSRKSVKAVSRNGKHPSWIRREKLNCSVRVTVHVTWSSFSVFVREREPEQLLPLTGHNQSEIEVIYIYKKAETVLPKQKAETEVLPRRPKQYCKISF